MRETSSHPQYKAFVVIAVMIVLGWMYLAPPLIGGRTSYVIVNGSSMHPVYERGDLVLVRQQRDYQVGDIVTYRHPTIGAIIHRIIDQDGARFILQGDNNDWLDSYKPLPTEVIGEEWVHLPKVGKAITWVRGPGLVICIIAVIGAGVVLPRSDQRRVGQRVPRTGQRPLADVRAQQPAQRQSPPSQRFGWLDQSARDALGWVGLLAAACLIVGGFAFMRPAERTVTVDGSYSQNGEFRYGAAAPSGIYDTEEVATGDPIFRSVSDTIGVQFDYQFSSELPADVSGTWDLSAVMSADNGWTRTIPLVANQAFEGSSFSTEATIDLAELNAITDRVSAQTGVSLDRFLLNIVPEVHVNGSVAGQPISEEFAPALAFRADPMELRLVSDDQDEALAPTSTGVVKLMKQETNTLPVLQWSVGVPFARLVAVAGLLLAGIVAAVILVVARQRGGTGSTTDVAGRYRAMLVDISDPDPAINSQGQVVAVRSFDDLARLAERDGQVILRHAANGFERFIVRCADITYQYSATPGATR